jgi:hypothetical protein
MFYEDRNRYLTVMQHSIAINGSFFNAAHDATVLHAYLR